MATITKKMSTRNHGFWIRGRRASTTRPFYSVFQISTNGETKYIKTARYMLSVGTEVDLNSLQFSYCDSTGN